MPAGKLIRCCLPAVLLPLAGHTAAGVADVGADDPALFMVMMLLLILLIGALVVGLVLLLLLALLAAVAVLTGMVSLSVLAGWYHRSAAKGLRVFVRLAFALAGLAGGLIAAWLFRHRLEAVPMTVLLPIGACGGIAGGWLSAGLFLHMLRKACTAIGKKLRSAAK